MKKLIIGISGKMGSGKSTLAKHIMELFPHAVTEKVAGDLYAIQDYIYQRTGLTMEGEKDRPLLIAIGEWGRGKSNSLWTDLCFKRVLSSEHEVIIIDDIRYPEEANALIQAGGLLVRLEGTQRGPNVDPKFANRESETALDNFDFKYRINNLGSMSSSAEQFDQILEEVGYGNSNGKDGSQRG